MTTQEARKTAKWAAEWLRERGATRVLLFGSLAQGEYVPEISDIDICFEGLDDQAALNATGRLLGILGEGKIDPLPAQFCSPRLREDIETEGVSI